MEPDTQPKLSVNIRPKYYPDEDILVGVQSVTEDVLIFVEDYFNTKTGASMCKLNTRAKLKGFELLPRISRDFKLIALVYDLGEPHFYLWICRFDGLTLQELKKIDLGSSDIVWMRALKSVSLQTITESPLNCLELHKINKIEKEYLPCTVLYVVRTTDVKILFFRDAKEIESLVMRNLGHDLKDNNTLDPLGVRTEHDLKDYSQDVPPFYDRDGVEHFAKNYSDQMALTKKHIPPKSYKSTPLFDVTLGRTVFVSQEATGKNRGTLSDQGPYCVVIADPLGLTVFARILLAQALIDSVSPNKSYLSGFFKSSSPGSQPQQQMRILPVSCQHLSLSPTGDLLSLFDFEGRNFHLFRLEGSAVSLQGVYTRGNSDGLIKEVQINSEGGYVVVGTHNHETIHVFQLDRSALKEETAPKADVAQKKGAFGVSLPSWKDIKNGLSSMYSAGYKSNAKFKRKAEQEIEVFSLGSGMLMLSVDGEWMKVADKDHMQREFSKPLEHLDITWTNNIFRDSSIEDIRFATTL